MTVKELIEKLQMFDENLIIAIPNKDRDEDNPYPYVFDIRIARGANEEDRCLYLFEHDDELESLIKCNN